MGWAGLQCRGEGVNRAPWQDPCPLPRTETCRVPALSCNEIAFMESAHRRGPEKSSFTLCSVKNKQLTIDPPAKRLGGSIPIFFSGGGASTPSLRAETRIPKRNLEKKWEKKDNEGTFKVHEGTGHGLSGGVREVGAPTPHTHGY